MIDGIRTWRRYRFIRRELTLLDDSLRSGLDKRLDKLSRETKIQLYENFRTAKNEKSLLWKADKYREIAKTFKDLGLNQEATAFNETAIGLYNSISDYPGGAYRLSAETAEEMGDHERGQQFAQMYISRIEKNIEEKGDGKDWFIDCAHKAAKQFGLEEEANRLYERAIAYNLKRKNGIGAVETAMLHGDNERGQKLMDEMVEWLHRSLDRGHTIFVNGTIFCAERHGLKIDVNEIYRRAISICCGRDSSFEQDNIDNSLEARYFNEKLWRYKQSQLTAASSSQTQIL